jgi:hypothetical protein
MEYMKSLVGGGSERPVEGVCDAGIRTDGIDLNCIHETLLPLLGWVFDDDDE